MATVALTELLTSLPEVVARVERGEEVLIARDGKAVVRMTAVEPVQASPPGRSLLGAMKGKIWIADDFDAPMTEEELREWYDRPIRPAT
jgi:antitoxin (DNA-binding transcriptional repressor) of toxin-antitoxin stability system